MVAIKLPDGSVKEYPEGVRPREVAEGIGKRLAEAAVAAVADGKVVDLDRPLDDGAGTPIELRILTGRDREALDVLRHSSAHIMARAILRLFPGARLAFGPTTANGFYYDVDLPDRPLSEDDFPAIEAEMAKIIKESEPFERFSLPVAEARAFVDDLGQGYKVEHIDDELHKYGVVSFYRQGEFVDLCRGPHIPHAGKVGAVKLLSIAGAYWKGRTDRKMLQRVYGTAFFDKKDLDAYLSQIEESKKRDHRRLGKELGLFTISPLVGSGLILWMPKGAIVRGILETFLKDELLKRGYQPVYTPNIGKIELYRTSGHYPYYKDSQFPPIQLLSDAASALVAGLEKGSLDEDAQLSLLTQAGIDPRGFAERLRVRDYKAQIEYFSKYSMAHNTPGSISFGPDDDPKFIESLLRKYDVNTKGYFERDTASRIDFVKRFDRSESYLLKPMNCPHHIQIFAAQPRSYRDLPVRLAEFGTVYRYEQSGELSGLTRVRGFTQDDAHLFCTPDQVRGEFRATMELTQFVLGSLGLGDYRVRLSKSDPTDPKFAGAEGETWRRAEEDIRAVLDEMKLPYDEAPGEAAFYGPKADFLVRDCLGRQWQLGTVQLDYVLPKRFGLEYIGRDNKPALPVMIHRAPFGSMERFMGILIEHFAGAFPLWLAPEQVRVLPISEKVADYAASVLDALRAAGLRAELDGRPEKIGAKIRDAQLEKVPVMLVVGAKEAEARAVSFRDRHDGDLGPMPLADALARLRAEADARTIRHAAAMQPAVLPEDGQEKHAY